VEVGGVREEQRRGVVREGDAVLVRRLERRRLGVVVAAVAAVQRIADGA